jgi:hypothetical protein
VKFAEGTLGRLLGPEWVREIVEYRRHTAEIRRAIEARRRTGVPPVTSGGNRKSEPSLDEMEPRGRTQ